MRIAVTGASGFVGRHIVRALRARGHAVRVLARDPARLPFSADGVEVVTGALADAPALDQLAAGVNAVIHLVGIIAEKGDATFGRIHVEGARRVAAAAAGAGVTRFVHMSAVGARHDAAATPYHRSKAAGEDAVRAAGLPFVILRPTIIIGPESAPLTLLARLHRFLPAVPIFGDGAFPMQPVWIGDVADAFCRAAEGAAPDGTYELGGPERLTYADFVEAIGRAVGRPRPLVRVPLGLVRLAAGAFDVLPPDLAPITTHQLQMLVEGSAVAENAMQPVFGLSPVDVAEALRRTVANWNTDEDPKAAGA